MQRGRRRYAVASLILAMAFGTSHVLANLSAFDVGHRIGSPSA